MEIHINDLIGKLTQYSSNVLVAKAKSWPAKFAIGAGTEAMSSRAEPFIRATGAVMEDGTVDLESLHRIVMSGFKTAGHLDLFGGLIGFDTQDVDDLFAWIGR